MYRAVAWLLRNEGVNPKDQIDIKKCLKNLKLKLKPTGNSTQVIINGNDVTNAIRAPEITSTVSLVAANHFVREALTSQQKQIGLSGGLVAEGRDIGTTVFPHAELKIFLTASATERAKRRVLDLKSQGFSVTSQEEIEKQIIERDRLDSSRENSPLIKAEDAEEVMTDGMSVDEVLESIEDLFRIRVPEEIWPTPSS